MTDTPHRPRILIFGAGAVGTLLGGILANAGHDVTLLGRGTSIQAIGEHGLTVQMPDRRFHVHPKTITSTAPLPLTALQETDAQFDIVFLTVRSFAIPDALEVLNGSSQMSRDGRPYQSLLLKKSGALVTLQNGIGTEELIAQTLPDTRHIAASLTLSAEIDQPGNVTSTSRSGGISLAPVSPDASAAAIADYFRDTGIPTSVIDDYRSMKWSKLLLNQMGNGIPAILNWMPGEVYRHPETFQIEQAMLRETLRVIAADDARLISLPGFPVPLLKWGLGMPPWIARRLLIPSVEGGRGDKPPSLLLDLRSERAQTEARWLYDAVVDIGERHGIDAPVNQRVYRILEAITTNPRLRDAFQDNPDRLIRNVQFSIEGKPHR